MDVGRDNGLAVDRASANQARCAFTGTVKTVPYALEPEEEKARRRESTLLAVAHGA